MEYDDVEGKLSILRTVTMNPERGHDIEQVLQAEIQKYRAKGRWRTGTRTFVWIGSAVAAVVVCAMGVGAVMHVHHTHVGITTNFTTALHGTPTTASIKYTSVQMTQIKQVANAVGVVPMVPSQGQQGDVLTIIKNGGKGQLILDYKTFWIMERSSPISDISRNPTRKTIHVGSQTATYLPANSFLYFENNGTYFAIQSLKVGVKISEQNLRAIAESLQPVQ